MIRQKDQHISTKIAIPFSKCVRLDLLSEGPDENVPQPELSVKVSKTNLAIIMICEVLAPDRIM